jgi:hypothetical protein
MERDRRNERLIVAAVAFVLSIVAVLWVYFHGELLLYGDAVGHINIARRVFDSRHPSPLQLGTVWLPFPHVAVMPFIVNDWMWRTGIGGSIPSMIAYVLGVLGIFRLVRARAPLWVAGMSAALYGFNPNLLYMQSTAMTETIFLATVIWSMVYLDEFVRGLFADGSSAEVSPANTLDPNAALRRLAYCLSLSILTRYDGWFFSGIVGSIVVVCCLVRWGQAPDRTQPSIPRWAGIAFRRILWIATHVTDHFIVGVRAKKPRPDPIPLRLRTLLDFLLLPTLAAGLWLAMNYAVSGDPLDFMRGPYSARAIAERTTADNAPPYPGERTPITAGLYFLKCAKLNVADGWWEHILLALALLGTVLAIRNWRRYGVLLLLWIPLPFYMFSIAYGSVPIFIPQWWPFSYYNVRYGMQLIPMFGVFVPFAVYWLVHRIHSRRKLALALSSILLIGSIPFTSPITLGEARVNSHTRMMLEARLAEELRKLPPDSTLLMYTGEYVGALQQIGFPLKRVIWEGIHTEWDESIAAPTRYADYIVAYENDPVSYMVNAFPQNMELIAEFQTPEKPRVRIYRTIHRGRRN